MQTVHGILREYQCDGQKDEHHCPEGADTFIWLLLRLQSLIRVARNDHRQRVKCGGIECDHCDRQQNQAKFRQRERIKYFHDCLGIIAACRNKAGNVKAMLELLCKAVIAKDDKRGKGARKAPAVTAEDRIANSTTLADHADKKRCCNAPDHPVGPVINRPVLREACFPQRIHPCCQPDEVLGKIADCGKTRFQNIARLSTAKQDIGQQRKEAITANGGELRDSFHAEPDRKGVDCRDHQKDCYR